MKRFPFVALLSVAVVLACGNESKKKSEQPSNSKENKPGPGSKPRVPKVAKPKVLPPPPKENMAGKGRIINLYADANGKTHVVDVWAGRSFKFGPVLLAKGIAIGKASDWFDCPKGQSIKVVPTGTGPDSKQSWPGIFTPKQGEHITGIVTWDGKQPSTGSYWESGKAGTNNIPAAPPEGKALLMLRAYALSAHDKALRDVFGGRSFYVGAGKGKCLPQRKGQSILGGTNPTLHDIAPKKTQITLHKWPSNKKCDSEPVFAFDVTPTGNKGTMVLLYTTDAGKSISTLTVPMAVAAGS